MNMHKWLLTNFDVSCLYVRERKHLVNAFSLTPSYVRNAASESGLVFDYRYSQASSPSFKSYVRSDLALAVTGKSPSAAVSAP